MPTVNIAVSQFRNQVMPTLIALTIPVLILILVYSTGRYFQLELSDLTRDPSAVLKGPAYVGFLSNLGIFFWSASAVICFFTSWLLRSTTDYRDYSGMLFWSGMLSLMLGFDDAFQLHEKFFSNIRYVPEELFFLFYFVCTVMITWVYRASFFKTEYLIWSSAMLAFALSIVIDKKIWVIQNDRAFYEDAFKFTGIVIWTVYYLRTSGNLLKDRRQTNLSYNSFK
jgi:hypothetical protein